MYSSGAPPWEDAPHVASTLLDCAFAHTQPQNHKNGPCRPGHTLPPHSHTTNVSFFFLSFPLLLSTIFFLFPFFSLTSLATPDLGTLG